MIQIDPSKVNFSPSAEVLVNNGAAQKKPTFCFATADDQGFIRFWNPEMRPSIVGINSNFDKCQKGFGTGSVRGMFQIANLLVTMVTGEFKNGN